MYNEHSHFYFVYLCAQRLRKGWIYHGYHATVSGQSRFVALISSFLHDGWLGLRLNDGPDVKV